MKSLNKSAFAMALATLVMLIGITACRAAELTVINDTRHDEMTFYGIYEREWDHGEGRNGSWGGWRQLGVIPAGGSFRVHGLAQGRWRIAAQTRHGRVISTQVMRVINGRENVLHLH